jgi:hypothetical protein
MHQISAFLCRYTYCLSRAIDSDYIQKPPADMYLPLHFRQRNSPEIEFPSRTSAPGMTLKNYLQEASSKFPSMHHQQISEHSRQLR